MGSTAETQITPVQVTDDEAALFAMQLASASVLPMVLKSALDLDLLEIMAKNSSPMSPSEIASKLQTKTPKLRSCSTESSGFSRLTPSSPAPTVLLPAETASRGFTGLVPFAST